MAIYEVWARPAYEETPEVYWIGEAETDSDAISIAKVEGVGLRPDLIDWEAVLMEVTDMKCQSCEVLSINGVRCHETGCPDAWKDDLRMCKWCGGDFIPEERQQRFCDPGCMRAYHGWPEEDAEEVDDVEKDEDDDSEDDSVGLPEPESLSTEELIEGWKSIKL